MIEVGPGTGTLTEELLARGATVTACEIDRDLAGLLRERFSGIERFSLIEGDALAGKHALNPALLATIRATGSPIKLVANLPYNIASPLVIELLIAGLEMLVFTVQKEVADRLKAAADSDDYGPLTVMAQLLSHVEVIRKLPPEVFWPPPKIDSSLVRMKRANRLGEDAAAFSTFVHQVFSARRKTLRKALANAGYENMDPHLKELNLDPQCRAEQLTPATLFSLFGSIRSVPTGAATQRGR